MRVNRFASAILTVAGFACDSGSAPAQKDAAFQVDSGVPRTGGAGGRDAAPGGAGGGAVQSDAATDRPSGGAGGSGIGGSSTGAGGRAGAGGSAGAGGRTSAGGGGAGGGGGGAGGVGGSSGGTIGTPNVTIDRATEYQTIEGFGFFGAQDVWWGSASNMWSDAWGELVIKDLGLSIWRNEYYSEEGSDASNQDATFTKQLPVIQGLKRIADANRVPLKFIATVWSAPSDMKCTVASVQAGQNPCTRHPGGLKNGGTLDPAKYSAFADWLVRGIKKYTDAGVELYALSPQNEPMFVEPYNSCVYDITPTKLNSYSRMIKAVYPIVKQAYPNLKLYGTENMLGLEGQPWFYSAYMDAPAWSNFDLFAYHGYSDGVVPTQGSQLAQYWITVRDSYAKPQGKASWMTETSGYNDIWLDKDGAFQLGFAIYAALAHGQVSAWVWWQGSDLGGPPNQYTLMGGPQNLSKRYYVSKNFYRYIRPGAKMVKVTSSDESLLVVAFTHASMGSFTVVAINSSSQDKPLTLGGADVPASYSAYRTSANENCASLGSANNGSITLKANSITTLVNGNVVE